MNKNRVIKNRIDYFTYGKKNKSLSKFSNKDDYGKYFIISIYKSNGVKYKTITIRNLMKFCRREKINYNGLYSSIKSGGLYKNKYKIECSNVYVSDTRVR